MKEYAIWGVVDPDDGERLLVTQYRGRPITDRTTADHLAVYCESKGATGVRVQAVDLDTPPDFTRDIVG